MLFALLVVAASLAVALMLPVLSYLRAARADRTVQRLAVEVAGLRRELDALRMAGAPPAVPETQDVAAAPVSNWHETVQELRRVADEPAAPVEPPAMVDVPAVPPASPQPAPAESLEQRIGARWLLYAGMAALILGISYFIKFAFDNGWVSEPLRVGIGLASGVALVGAGLRFSRQGLALFGQVLTGGGIVVLYLALYAALHVYALLSPTTAFVAMAVVTAVSAALAHRDNAQALAVMALVGGFATPFLVGGDRDAQVVLFSYIAVLLAGTTVLALRHAWPLLHLLGYALTALVVAAWSVSYYTSAAWLRTELFLTLFLAMALHALFSLRRQPAPTLVDRAVVLALATAPLLYHLASVAILGPHPGALLIYVVLVTVAGLSVSHHANLPWLRSVVLVLVGVPLMAWMSGLRRPAWYAGAVVTACAVYALHLAGQWRAVSDDEAPDAVPVSEVVHAHLNGLFLPATLYIFLDERAAWWNPPMLTALALWNAAIAGVLRARLQTLPWQYAALAATLAAVAIGVWFDGPAVAVGWALEGAALAWLAVERQNAWLRGGSAVLFGLGALRLLEMLARPLALTSTAVINTRTLAAALVIGALLWTARVLRRTPDAPAGRDVLILGAHVLAIAWMSSEITALFGQRAYMASADDRPVGVARAELFEQVALSVAWAAYAVALIALGIMRRYAPARYLGIVLFGLTIVKVMTRDIAQLDRVYQMLSVLGVGGLLLLASYLYQRMARVTPPDASAAPAHETPHTPADPVG